MIILAIFIGLVVFMGIAIFIHDTFFLYDGSDYPDMESSQAAEDADKDYSIL